MKAGCRLWGEDSTRRQVAKSSFAVWDTRQASCQLHAFLFLLADFLDTHHRPRAPNQKILSWTSENQKVPISWPFAHNKNLDADHRRVGQIQKRYSWLSLKQVEVLATCRSRPLTDIGNLIMLVHHRCLPTPHRHKKSITKHSQAQVCFFFLLKVMLAHH